MQLKKLIETFWAGCKSFGNCPTYVVPCGSCQQEHTVTLWEERLELAWDSLLDKSYMLPSPRGVVYNSRRHRAWVVCCILAYEDVHWNKIFSQDAHPDDFNQRALAYWKWAEKEEKPVEPQKPKPKFTHRLWDIGENNV